MNFRDLYNSTEDSDIKIKCGKKLINAHKLILKHGSPVLKAAFNSKMKEVSADVYEFKDHDDEVSVEIVIKYMYGVPVDFNNIAWSVRVQVLRFADRLGMIGLFREIVSKPIPAGVSAAEVVKLAHMFNSETLFAASVGVFLRNTKNADGVTPTLVTEAESMLVLDETEYKLFRRQWLLTHESPYHLLFTDCMWCHNTQENPEKKLDTFITDIPLTNFTDNQLTDAAEFPVIEDQPALVHALICMSRRVKKPNSVDDLIWETISEAVDLPPIPANTRNIMRGEVKSQKK